MKHKQAPIRDVKIATSEDWQKFQYNLEAGTRVERVIVEPIDPVLIRNSVFAQELARLAASKGFVIDLAGGLLSHAYYILRREGAQVECTDLFGTDEDRIDFNKLVRDYIPRYIEGQGERVESVRLRGEALIVSLRRKLVEESYEALDAKSGDELLSELADVQEVSAALIKALHVPISALASERREKKKQRGGFDEGLMLIRTTAAHSIPREELVESPRKLPLPASKGTPRIISRSRDLPNELTYRRPDLRHVEDKEVEKLITFEFAANWIEETKQTYKFSMAVQRELEKQFALNLQVRRSGATIRCALSLRLDTDRLEISTDNPQLPLKF